MSLLAIFVYGAFVSAIIGTALGLLAWGIVNEGRDRRLPEQGERSSARRRRNTSRAVARANRGGRTREMTSSSPAMDLMPLRRLNLSVSEDPETARSGLNPRSRTSLLESGRLDLNQRPLGPSRHPISVDASRSVPASHRPRRFLRL